MHYVTKIKYLLFITALYCVSLLSLPRQETVQLFVGLRVAPQLIHSIPFRHINHAIKKRITSDYKVYTPDMYHVTLATIGEIDEKDLPKVYETMNTYINSLANTKVQTAIGNLRLDPQEPLDYFPGKFNKFFVLKLVGPTSDIEAMIIKPLKNLIQCRLGSLLPKSETPAKELPFHPHISIGKVKNMQRSPEDIHDVLTPLINDIPQRAYEIKAAAPTIVLYQGVTGGFKALKEYRLDTASMVKKRRTKKMHTFLVPAQERGHNVYTGVHLST